MHITVQSNQGTDLFTFRYWTALTILPDVLGEAQILLAHKKAEYFYAWFDQHRGTNFITANWP